MPATRNRGRVRRRRVTVISLAAVFGAAAITLAACTSNSNDAQQQGQQLSNTTYAEFAAAVPYPFANAAPTDPLERENLSRRLTQYNSKGDTNYVYIFAGQSGQVVGYYVIDGKVSSTGSQMTATQSIENCNSNGGGSCSAVDAVGDDGSYGPEEGGSNGVFFFTSTGVLVETDMPFLVSSAPIKIYSSVPQLDAPAQ